MLNLFQHLSYITPPQSSPSREEEQFRKYRCGFTLAEVLITLVIIGVIAAITVPTLITKYQKEQTVTRLKKAYSALSQTTQRAIADNGPIKTWEVGTAYSGPAATDFLNKYVTPYMSVMKKANNNLNDWDHKYYNVNSETAYTQSCSRFYLNDGTSVTAIIQTNNSTEIKIELFVDINGDKKPNNLGRDIFRYLYYVYSGDDASLTGKFVPPGSNYSRNSILSVCNNTSKYWCSTLIMKDSWQIKDDYPW
ncbi:type II secretion system protein [bacterium]|nr:type II secretion system protein [bacterium]